MSMMLMVQAMKTKVGNPLRKLVLIKLADNANDKGECWPSYQHIADQCEIGKSTVKKHIKQLEIMGLLRIENRKGPKGNSSNLYHLRVQGGSLDNTGCGSPDSTRISNSFEPVIEPLVPASQKRSKFKFTDEDLRFAGEMFKRILVVTPSAKKPNLENWANTIRLMRESDNRDHTTMWAVFDWANRDSFWCSNILSPDKLRKQFDKLQVKKNETNQPRNATTGRKLSAVEENNARLLAKYGNPTAPSERTINPTEYPGMDSHEVPGGLQQQVAPHGVTIDMDAGDFSYDDKGDPQFRF